MPEISYRIVPVTTTSWHDQGRDKAITSLISASVSRSIGSGATTLEDGNLVIFGPLGYEPPEGWYRLEGIITTSGSQMFPIATLRLSPTGFNISHGRIEYTMQGKSVLQPLAERKIRRGDYIAKGSNAAHKLGQMIREATPAPVVVDGSFSLKEYYVLDPASTYLEAVWGVLDKAGWCMQLSTTGVIFIRKKPKSPALTLDRSTKALLRPGISGTYGWSTLPNRLTVLDWYGSTYTVVNKDPDSRVSVKKRGYYIDEYDSSPQLKTNETIQTYAKRRLKELSTWTEPFTYTRNWLIDKEPMLFDIVRATLPTDGIEGDMRVTSQQIDCGTSIGVTETAEVEHKEYEP